MRTHDHGRKSETRVANGQQNRPSREPHEGKPGADWYADHHAGKRRGHRNDQRLADDDPSLGVAGDEQEHCPDEPLTDLGPIVPGTGVHATALSFRA